MKLRKNGGPNEVRLTNRSFSCKIHFLCIIIYYVKVKKVTAVNDEARAPQRPVYALEYILLDR